ncbi:MAG: hypothetical protein M1518_00670 [Candidatus Thermoplasmatota archaeon]|jgi:hypothetical protein|nr:hypothetical protein [Candidatus Thermoplasmatota archaeon]
MTEDFELLRKLKLEGQEIVFSQEKKRMILLSELWDSSKTKIMEELSQKYGIESREKFQEFKEKYNLTDY